MEIERKWLADINKIPYDLDKLERHEIEQRYISVDPTVRIRKIDDEIFILTIKTKPADLEGDLARNEAEISLDGNEYNTLKEMSIGNTIIKTRYVKNIQKGLKEEIDVFHGRLEGLCYLEIEFPSVDEANAYPTPDWVRKDVTLDCRYKNGYLACEEFPLEELLR